MTDMKVELLSPAGDMDSLIAAVQNGADAVYIGGKSFGARNFSKNFEEKELEAAVDYCHLRGVSVYVTVNTLVLDKEIKAFADFIKSLAVMGVDAVIVQDVGMIEVIRQVCPRLSIHASTQMSVHSFAGAMELEKVGVQRVILARELSRRNIEYITKNCEIETEVFVHGALCMCYSGQCAMSSIIGGGGRSANRGRCAQPCRLLYFMDGLDKKRYLSLKDLCMLEYLSEIKHTGVKSLKIEGRMKGVSYVSEVTRIYRKYLDSGAKPSQQDIKRLLDVFDRGGITNGYYTGNKGKSMFALNDKDNPYSDTEYIAQEEKKIPVCGIVFIEKDKQPQIEIYNENNKITYISDEIPQEAVNKPLTADEVKSQISKTGGTAFEFSELTVKLDDNLWLSASQLNMLRREGLKLFEQEIIGTFKRTEVGQYKAEQKRAEDFGFMGYSATVRNMEQFEVVKEFDIKYIYVPVHIVYDDMSGFENYKDKIILTLPVVIQDSETEKYTRMLTVLRNNGFENLQINNIAGLSEFKGFKLYGGSRLNIFNSLALEFYGERNVQIAALSVELNLSQIRDLQKTIPVEVTGYGRLPLMVTENCVIKHKKCPCNGEGKLEDRKGIEFNIIKDGNECRSVILNSRHVLMHDKIDDIINAGVSLINLFFTVENEDETRKICDLYINKSSKHEEIEYTRGHFYKGVV